jgi:putative ABC transport system permease protein
VYRRTGFTVTATVGPYRDQVVGQVRTRLVVLLAAVAMVLLIACADVANLILTRAAARQREMAIRIALGAGRARLIRQSLVESGALALGGAVSGLILAQWGTAALVRAAPFNIPRSQDIRIDAGVLVFTVALTMATALLFGLAPALESARKEVGESLKENSRTGAGGRRRGRMLGALVSVQFALALVLLIGAGLLVRSFGRLLATDPGFRPEHVISAHTSLPAATYSQAGQVRGFYDRLLVRLRTLPGVKAVAASTYLPLGVRERRGFTIDGQEGAPDGTPSMVAVDWPLGDYFQALGIPLRAGRFFTAQDNAAAAQVVIINENLARHFFPGRDPIDKRLKWGARISTSPWMTIVGVVGDVKQGPLQNQVVPQTWQPYPQTPDATVAENIVGLWRSLDLIVRTDGDPAALANAIRAEVRRLDPALPLTNVQALTQMVRNSAGPQRFNTFLLSSFAIAALLLAAMGISGVLAYAVSQRTQEIGIRMALGATRSGVMRMVLGRGMLLAGAGMAAGLAASLALTQLLSKLLYGVSPRDPWTFLWAPVALAIVALMAIWVPARRATRVDPIIALRYE